MPATMIYHTHKHASIRTHIYHQKNGDNKRIPATVYSSNLIDGPLLHFATRVMRLPFGEVGDLVGVRGGRKEQNARAQLQRAWERN